MITIKAKLLFWKIERKVPLSLAFPYDTVGYLGTESAENLDVNKILMMMDYIPVQKGIEIDYDAYDEEQEDHRHHNLFQNPYDDGLYSGSKGD